MSLKCENCTDKEKCEKNKVKEKICILRKAKEDLIDACNKLSEVLFETDKLYGKATSWFEMDVVDAFRSMVIDARRIISDAWTLADSYMLDIKKEDSK